MNGSYYLQEQLRKQINFLTGHKFPQFSHTLRGAAHTQPNETAQQIQSNGWKEESNSYYNPKGQHVYSKKQCVFLWLKKMRNTVKEKEPGCQLAEDFWTKRRIHFETTRLWKVNKVLDKFIECKRKKEKFSPGGSTPNWWYIQKRHQRKLERGSGEGWRARCTYGEQ